MEMHRVTFVVFGEVAEMDEEPTSLVGAFTMAIAGPIASILTAAWGETLASGDVRPANGG